jgi:hypothetical protein
MQCYHVINSDVAFKVGPVSLSKGLASVLACLLGHAQPVQSANEQCAYERNIDTSLLTPLRTNLLDPGKKLDVGAVMADPKLAEYMRKMAQQSIRIAQDRAASCGCFDGSCAGEPHQTYFGDYSACQVLQLETADIGSSATNFGAKSSIATPGGVIKGASHRLLLCA